MAAQQNVCKYNKFGFCKYQDRCRNLHVNEICENSACDWSNCMQRHPMKCKYYTEFMICKFSPCAFKHVKNDEITDVDNEVCDDRFLEVERKIDNLEKQLSDKNDVIDGLVKKVNDLENVIGKNLNVIDELKKQHAEEENYYYFEENEIETL